MRLPNVGSMNPGWLPLLIPSGFKGPLPWWPTEDHRGGILRLGTGDWAMGFRWACLPIQNPKSLSGYFQVPTEDYGTAVSAEMGFRLVWFSLYFQNPSC